MTTNRRKKVSRQRASHTHGWGSMKKHRGSGHKGGAGMSGTGKRADSKKPSIWKDVNYFGRHGFKSLRNEITAVNVSHIDQHIKLFSDSQERGMDVVDLGKMGFGKLLGKGHATRKMLIKVKYASAKAIEAVKNAGGEVKL